jgi:cell division initiation protein
MRLTPLDIREQQFRRVMRGMDPEEVTAFLASVATEFEVLLTENKELKQRLGDLEEKIDEYRNMEKALRDTLLTAERVMTESKESAQREARLIVREAELAAQRATARIAQDVARVRRELVEMRRMKDGYLSRLRWLMRSHLEMLEGQAQEFVESDAAIGTPDPAEESPAETETKPHAAAPRSRAADPGPAPAPPAAGEGDGREPAGRETVRTHPRT